MDAKEARAAALKTHETRVNKEVQDALALIQQRVKEGLFKTEIPCADLRKDATKILQKDYGYIITAKRVINGRSDEFHTPTWVIQW